MPAPGRSFPGEGLLPMCMTGAITRIFRNPELPSCADVPGVAHVPRSVSGSSGPELGRGLTLYGGESSRSWRIQVLQNSRFS